MSERSKLPNYQPQMDGLRALAVFAVLLHHFDAPFNNLLNFGTLGVRYFFVVSGFLITRILLRSRTKCDAQQGGKWREIGSFQFRRLIRTMPTYYLFILIAASLGITPVRETLGWTMTFLTNFYIARLGYFPPTISHFWSLAVQEQFYFVWPILLYFLPRPMLRYVMFGMVAVAVGFRFYCIQTDTSELIRWFNPLGNLDSFAVGGILAQFSISNPRLIEKRSTRIWTGIGATIFFLMARQLRLLPLENPLTIWIELLEALTMGWLVACSVVGFRGWLGRLLSWAPLTYVGQISYGIYIFHILVSVLLLPVLQKFGLTDGNLFSQTLRFVTEVAVTLAVSSVSWHFYEVPMLKLRDKLVSAVAPKTAA